MELRLDPSGHQRRSRRRRLSRSHSDSVGAGGLSGGLERISPLESFDLEVACAEMRELACRGYLGPQDIHSYWTWLAPGAESEGRRLLDLGCGRGGLGRCFARLLGTQVVGVDGSAEILADGIVRFGSAASDEFRVGRLERLPLPTASIDLFLSIDALHLSNPPSLAIAELARVTRSGARGVAALTFRTEAQSVPWLDLFASAGLEVFSTADTTLEWHAALRLKHQHRLENGSRLRVLLGEQHAARVIQVSRRMLGWDGLPAELPNRRRLAIYVIRS